MSAAPIPVEVGLSSGIVLRGLEYEADGPTVVLFHDIGEDLDVWAVVAGHLRRQGFRVVSLELRGHGLSDGDPDPDATVDDVRGALRMVSGSFGPVGFVAHGAVASVGFGLGERDGVPVQIVVSPLPSGEAGDVPRVPSMRAIFVGSSDVVSAEYTQRIHPRLLGQNMWFSTGSDASGPGLLEASPQLLEQVVMFLRRYLTGHHLSWIADETG